MFRWEFIHEQGDGDSKRANVFPVWEGLGFISNEKGNNWKALLVWVSTVRRSEQQVFLDLDTSPCIWNTSRLCSHGGLRIFCMPLSQTGCRGMRIGCVTGKNCLMLYCMGVSDIWWQTAFATKSDFFATEEQASMLKPNNVIQHCGNRQIYTFCNRCKMNMKTLSKCD